MRFSLKVAWYFCRAFVCVLASRVTLTVAFVCRVSRESWYAFIFIQLSAEPDVWRTKFVKELGGLFSDRSLLG